MRDFEYIRIKQGDVSVRTEDGSIIKSYDPESTPIETVDSSVIENLATIIALYKANGTLDSILQSVDGNPPRLYLEGVISCTGVYEDSYLLLNETFNHLIIEADKRYIRFEDPLVYKSLSTNAAVTKTGSSVGVNLGDGTGITMDDVLSVTRILGENLDVNIRKFTELKYFTNITEISNLRFINTHVLINLEEIDLSSITDITRENAFRRASNLHNIGEILLIKTLAAGCFGLDTNFDEKYANLIMPNLDGIPSKKYCTGYGMRNLPNTVRYFYAKNCTHIGTSAFANTNIEYVFLPSVGTIGGDYFITYNTCFRNCTNLKLISIGTADLSVESVNISRNMFYEGLFNYSRSEYIDRYSDKFAYPENNPVYVIHNNRFVGIDFDSSYIPTISPSRNIYVNSIEYVRNTYIPYFASRIHEIGYSNWKQEMLAIAKDRKYQLPQDGYTDFYYPYIDYLIGDVDLPASELNDPTSIQIRAERIGVLQNGQSVSSTYDGTIKISVFTDSYKNASTLLIIDNNANVTIDSNRVITVPSSANGETITIVATNLYDPSLTTSVTVHVYSYSNKYLQLEEGIAKRLIDCCFGDGIGITISDLLLTTDFPYSVFSYTKFSNLDELKYTKITRIQNGLFHGCESNGTTGVMSITIPETVTYVSMKSFFYKNSQFNLKFTSSIPPLFVASGYATNTFIKKVLVPSESYLEYIEALADLGLSERYIETY